MKRLTPLVTLLIVMLTMACSPTDTTKPKQNVNQLASATEPCTIEANPGGVERVRLFSATANGTEESLATATEQLNKQVSLWFDCNSALKVISIEHRDTSTGNLPKDAFAYNTVSVTITILVHYK